MEEYGFERQVRDPETGEWGEWKLAGGGFNSLADAEEKVSAWRIWDANSIMQNRIPRYSSEYRVVVRRISDWKVV